MIPGQGAVKQFIFGDTVISGGPLTEAEAGKIIARGIALKEKGNIPSQEEILAVFFRLSTAWSDPHYKKRLEAIAALKKNSGLGEDFINAVMSEFSKMLYRDYLLHKLEGELGSFDIQTRPVVQRDDGARLTVQPAGLVLHVASGNVFLACIESLINGIITRNINFVKMSTDDRDFPVIFAESIREFDPSGAIARRMAVLWWRGGDEAVERHFKQGMDRIIFWGSGEALKNWESGLGESTLLIRHGPKISFGVVSCAGLAGTKLSELTDNIATDIAIWEQKACNCPQVIFVEESVRDSEMKCFIDSLSESMIKINAQFAPATRSNDEYVEVLKARELAAAKGIVTGKNVCVIGPKTLDWTVIYEERSSLGAFEPSPLNRTIVVRRYSSLKMLAGLFKGYSFYLQTVGYCLDKDQIPEYTMKLSSLGVTRLCPFGVMAIPAVGTPHDGSFALRDLTRFTVVEG